MYEISYSVLFFCTVFPCEYKTSFLTLWCKWIYLHTCKKCPWVWFLNSYVLRPPEIWSTYFLLVLIFSKAPIKGDTVILMLHSTYSLYLLCFSNVFKDVFLSAEAETSIGRHFQCFTIIFAFTADCFKSCVSLMWLPILLDSRSISSCRIYFNFPVYVLSVSD